MAVEQDYCDWCYGPIGSEDRERSRDAGLGEDSAFSCRSCIDAGRIYSPPEGWDGEPGAWPVKDISGLVSLARENVETVLGDVQRMTDLQPTVTVDTYMGAIRIAYGPNFTTPSVFSTSNPAALAETADYLQDHIAEELCSTWPVCPIHDKGLHAQVWEGAAVWRCWFGSHPVTAVGSLGAKGPQSLPPKRHNL